MRKRCSIFALALVAAALPVLAQAPAGPASQPPQPAAAITRDTTVIKGNVQTVEALVKFENELAIEKMENERRAADLKRGVPTTRSSKPKGPSPMVMTVESIHGLPGQLRANVVANGRGMTNLKAGADVGTCQVQAIQDRCVVLTPRATGARGATKGTARKASPVCPTTCWTGIQALPMAGGSPGMPPMAGGPLPMSPGAPGSVAASQ